MVLLNASSRARNATQTVNQCQGGGSKKPGLISRQVPAAVSMAYSSSYRSAPNTMIMQAWQKNVTNGVGVGRTITGIRQSAWNTNGTSANICMINSIAEDADAVGIAAAIAAARVVANSVLMSWLVTEASTSSSNASSADTSTIALSNLSISTTIQAAKSLWQTAYDSASSVYSEAQKLTKTYTAAVLADSQLAVSKSYLVLSAFTTLLSARSDYDTAKALSDATPGDAVKSATTATTLTALNTALASAKTASAIAKTAFATATATINTANNE